MIHLNILRNKKRFLWRGCVAFIFIILLLGLVGCSTTPESPPAEIVKETDEGKSGQPESKILEPPPPHKPEPEPKPYTKEAQLLAVGDIMMHKPQTSSGYDPNTNTYAYDYFFTEVKEILGSGDWVIGNLETPLAGEEMEYTGYPLFNGPPELLDAVKGAGFTILTNANNHALDRGEKGILKTLDNIASRGLQVTGTARTLQESEEILVVTKNDIAMAFLAYTYGTNGIPIPKGKEYLVNLIDKEKIISDIQRARELGVDVITISLHFGVEYQRQPSTEQQELVKELIAAGADLILGSHPHVVQPYQFVEVVDSNNQPRKGLVIYSLGNFISAQQGIFKETGVIFGVTIKKNYPEQTIEFGEVTPIPTWVHRYRENNKSRFRVLPLEDIVTERDDPFLKEEDYPILQGYLEVIKQHVNSLNEK